MRPDREPAGSCRLKAAAFLLLAWSVQADEINTGTLRFLDHDPPGGVHEQSMQVHITADSLLSGWVITRQCHRRMDAIRAMEFVFRKGRTRGLRVLSSEKIDKAWVEGDSVQLTGVAQGAELCLAAEVHSLQTSPDGVGWVLTSGPFLRRFLDGYFPIQLTLSVEYPSDRIRLVSLDPPGLLPHTRNVTGLIRIDTRFEGRLLVESRFQPAAASP